jgi:hypothetical protein
MNRDQAIKVIQTVLDQAIKNGIANNMQEANAIVAAFNVILQELSKADG